MADILAARRGALAQLKAATVADVRKVGRDCHWETSEACGLGDTSRGEEESEQGQREAVGATSACGLGDTNMGEEENAQVQRLAVGVTWVCGLGSESGEGRWKEL
eukprot:1273486-Rhodomonas_salina.1